MWQYIRVKIRNCYSKRKLNCSFVHWAIVVLSLVTFLNLADTLPLTIALCCIEILLSMTIPVNQIDEGAGVNITVSYDNSAVSIGQGISVQGSVSKSGRKFIFVSLTIIF